MKTEFMPSSHPKPAAGAARVISPPDGFSRRALVFLAPSPFARSRSANHAMAALEVAAAADPRVFAFIALDDFIAERVVRAPGSSISSVAVVEAARAFLAGRHVAWPGDVVAIARLAAGILAAFRVPRSHSVPGEAGAVRGWRGLALSPK